MSEGIDILGIVYAQTKFREKQLQVQGEAGSLGISTLLIRDMKKWYKAPLILVFTVIQPILWLILFGKALAFNTAIGTQGTLSILGTTDYFSFLAVAILPFVALLSAGISSLSLIWDRRNGFLYKLLSTPIPRISIALVKVLSAIIRGLAQSVLLLTIAILLGMDITHLTSLGLLETFGALFLLAVGFSFIAITIASWTSQGSEEQTAILSLVNVPPILGSNAFFPIQYAAGWLQFIMRINPVSYAIDISRQTLLGAPAMAPLWFDFAYLILFAGVLALIGSYSSWKLLSKIGGN